jgi:hypothetical protein
MSAESCGSGALKVSASLHDVSGVDAVTPRKMLFAAALVAVLLAASVALLLPSKKSCPAATHDNGDKTLPCVGTAPYTDPFEGKDYVVDHRVPLRVGIVGAGLLVGLLLAAAASQQVGTANASRSSSAGPSIDEGRTAKAGEPSEERGVGSATPNAFGFNPPSAAPERPAPAPTPFVSPDEESSVTPGMKTCPDCAEEVRFAARKCRFCGFEFEQQSTTV